MPGQIIPFRRQGYFLSKDCSSGFHIELASWCLNLSNSGLFKVLTGPGGLNPWTTVISSQLLHPMKSSEESGAHGRDHSNPGRHMAVSSSDLPI